MKKLFVMAAMVLSSVGAFAQYNAGDVTIQPKVGLSIADYTDVDDSKTCRCCCWCRIGVSRFSYVRS